MTITTISRRTGASYTGVNNAYMSLANPTTNYDGVSFKVRNTTGVMCHAVIQFPGVANITGPVTVNSVTLKLYTESFAPDVTDVVMYKLLVANTTSQLTWNNRVTGTGWTSNGGYDASDATLTAVSTVTTTANGYTEFTFPDSADFRAMVQDWINNGSTANFAVLLTGSPEATGSKTTDWIGVTSPGLIDFGPLLTIDWTAGGGGPTVSTVSSNSATEGSSIVHTVTLSAAVTGSAASYAITLAGGTATGGGTDYTSTLSNGMFSDSVTVSGGNISVPVGVSTFTVTVSTAGDTIDEANETYTLTIGGTAGTGTINDDDAAPTITGTASSTVTAGDPVVITYSPGLSGQSRTYTLALTDGTAVGGTDYDNTTVTGDFAVTAGTGSVSISGSTVTVDPGVTEFTLTIGTTA